MIRPDHVPILAPTGGSIRRPVSHPKKWALVPNIQTVKGRAKITTSSPINSQAIKDGFNIRVEPQL